MNASQQSFRIKAATAQAEYFEKAPLRANDIITSLKAPSNNQLLAIAPGNEVSIVPMSQLESGEGLRDVPGTRNPEQSPRPAPCCPPFPRDFQEKEHLQESPEAICLEKNLLVTLHHQQS